MLTVARKPKDASNVRSGLTVGLTTSEATHMVENFGQMAIDGTFFGFEGADFLLHCADTENEVSYLLTEFAERSGMERDGDGNCQELVCLRLPCDAWYTPAILPSGQFVHIIAITPAGIKGMIDGETIQCGVRCGTVTDTQEERAKPTMSSVSHLPVCIFPEAHRKAERGRQRVRSMSLPSDFQNMKAVVFDLMVRRDRKELRNFAWKKSLRGASPSTKLVKKSWLLGTMYTSSESEDQYIFAERELVPPPSWLDHWNPQPKSGETQ